MKYGKVYRLGPASKYPGRWAMVLVSKGDRVTVAVYPEGAERPKELGRG